MPEGDSVFRAAAQFESGEPGHPEVGGDELPARQSGMQLGGRWRKPGFTARCVLRTAAADAVGFSLGILEVVRTSEEDSVVGHLGPDLLGPDWDLAEAERRIRAAPDVPIGVALLDQRNLAGIGNIYRLSLIHI